MSQEKSDASDFFQIFLDQSIGVPPGGRSVGASEAARRPGTQEVTGSASGLIDWSAGMASIAGKAGPGQQVTANPPGSSIGGLGTKEFLRRARLGEDAGIRIRRVEEEDEEGSGDEEDGREKFDLTLVDEEGEVDLVGQIDNERVDALRTALGFDPKKFLGMFEGLARAATIDSPIPTKSGDPKLIPFSRELELLIGDTYFCEQTFRVPGEQTEQKGGFLLHLLAHLAAAVDDGPLSVEDSTEGYLYEKPSEIQLMMLRLLSLENLPAGGIARRLIDHGLESGMWPTGLPGAVGQDLYLKARKEAIRRSMAGEAPEEVELDFDTSRHETVSSGGLGDPRARKDYQLEVTFTAADVEETLVKCTRAAEALRRDFIVNPGATPLTEVHFETNLGSLNRGIDSAFNAPILYLGGSGRHIPLPADPHFVRTVEGLGHYVPNVVVHRSEKPEVVDTSGSEVFDLGSRRHIVSGFSDAVPLQRNWICYRLAAGRRLYLEESAGDFAFFKGLAAFPDLLVWGVRADIHTKRDLKTVGRIRSEGELVMEAAKTAARLSEPLALVFFRHPSYLIRQHKDSTERQALQRVLDYYLQDDVRFELEPVPEDADGLFFTVLEALSPEYQSHGKDIDVIRKMWDSGDPELRKRLWASARLYLPKAESEEQKRLLVAVPEPPEQAHAGQFRNKEGVSTWDPEKAPPVYRWEVHFEGNVYEIDATSWSSFAPLTFENELHVPGGSRRLQTLFNEVRVAQIRNLVRLDTCSYRFSTGTSFHSVSAARRSASKGFGVSGEFWEEKVTANVRFTGTIAFPVVDDARIAALCELFNSQMLAETVHGGVKPYGLEIKSTRWKTVFGNLQSLVGRSRYLDSFEGFDSEEVRFRPGVQEDTVGNPSSSISGPARRTPKGFVKVVQKGWNFKIPRADCDAMGFLVQIATDRGHGVFPYLKEWDLSAFAAGATPEECFDWMTKATPKAVTQKAVRVLAPDAIQPVRQAVNSTPQLDSNGFPYRVKTGKTWSHLTVKPEKNDPDKGRGPRKGASMAEGKLIWPEEVGQNAAASKPKPPPPKPSRWEIFARGLGLGDAKLKALQSDLLDLQQGRPTVRDFRNVDKAILEKITQSDFGNFRATYVSYDVRDTVGSGRGSMAPPQMCVGFGGSLKI